MKHIRGWIRKSFAGIAAAIVGGCSQVETMEQLRTVVPDIQTESDATASPWDKELQDSLNEDTRDPGFDAAQFGEDFGSRDRETPFVPGAPEVNDPVDLEEFTLLDFESSELQDGAWVKRQPRGTAHTFVGPKGDSGKDLLSLAPGEGRRGSTALLVESPDKAAGLPGFWVMRGLGAGYGNATDRRGYFLPEGKRANQVEFWVRFQRGFRAKASSSPTITYPNHLNFIFGTYHFDPRKIGGGTPVKESDNWHFYHQIFVRHDRADVDWIRVVLNEVPQHQRGISAVPAVNPTMPAGNYYEIMTRFYIDSHRYFADPEIEYPVKMWVDDIKFRYVPPQHKIAAAFDGYQNGASVNVSASGEKSFAFTLMNYGDSDVEVRVAPTMGAQVKNSIVDQSGAVMRNVTIPAGGTVPGRMLLNFEPGTSMQRSFGISAVPLEQILSDSTSNHRSLTDGNVEKRWNNGPGPNDAEAKGAFLRIAVTP
ncbi:MAG: hypothetical protein RIQ81_214 [Pseudomonadota bacterium]